MQPAVKKEPCNSCRETPTFQYSYYNSGQRLPSDREAVYLCAKCRCYIPEVGTPDQSKERHAIGNARKRICCHPRCLTPGSILAVVHCSKKFCYDLNYHRVCYEDLKRKGGHSVSSSAVVETKVPNRTVYQAYCANHVPPPPRAAIRQTANANAANQRLQASSRSVPAVDAGEDSERKIPKKAGLQSKEEHAAAHEARAALLQGRAATERNRRISTQKLMDGTETKAAQDLLKKLQDTLGDPILVEACANLDQYSEKLELMLSQLSPSTKCSVVGPTGVGKSFFINCLLSCTETPHEIYASGQLRVFKPDGSIDLEAFHDRPSSHPPPEPYFVAAGALARPDDDAAVKGVKRVVMDGKIPPGTPGWLLTSESLGDVTTRANVTVAYGRTFHLKVYFYTKKEAKQMAFQRCQLDSSSTTAEVRFANSCWDLLVDTKKTPKNVDDPNDIVLKSGLSKLDTTEIYAGLGKDSTADRQFVREQLKSLMARQNSVEQLLIKSVIVYSPSAALIGTRITDVMGSNDANVVRTARTRVAINNSDALLVVLSKSLTAEANVVRMLEDSVFLEQLIENNSAKQLRVLVAVERGLSLCKLTDFNDQKTKMKFDKFFRTCENETREQLKKMLTHVAVAKGFPNPEHRVSQAMQLRVSIHCIWPALFWSLRLSRLGGSDELKRTGMLQALGMQRFLDVSATLSGFQQCIEVSDGDEKELKIEGSIAADLEANITARLSEFQDSSEEVEDLRETAELWAQPTSVEKWDTLKKNYETQLSDVHTAWRKAARKRISSFQKRIRTHVLVPNSTTEARVQKLLRDVNDSNKAIKLKARSTPGDLSRALFDSVKRIPFEELNAELKSLFEEFLEGDFKKLFVDMLEVIFDRKSVVSKSFQPVQERIWRVAKSKAFQYYNLILFDPQLKDNYEVSNLVALQQKAQLTALRDIQQSCFADWMEIEGVSQLRQQCAKDLQKVYSAVCNHLEIQWDGIAKHKMNLFHDLLFSKVQPSVKLPQGLEQAAESECLLHATLRTCVEDATAMGVANDPAIKLPIEELKALQLNLQKWKIDAKNMHEKLKNLVKYPREWMANVGERLCGIQAPPPAAGPVPSSSTAPVPVSRAPRTGAVRAACPPPGPAAVPRPSATNPRVAGVVRAPVVDLTSPEADTGAVPRPLQRRRMNPVPQVVSTNEKEDGEIDDDEDMLQAPPLRHTRSQNRTTADMDADIESPAHSPAPRSSRVVAENTRKPSRR